VPNLCGGSGLTRRRHRDREEGERSAGVGRIESVEGGSAVR
jgi:hypothetical protein